MRIVGAILFIVAFVVLVISWVTRINAGNWQFAALLLMLAAIYCEINGGSRVIAAELRELKARQRRRFQERHGPERRG